MFPDYRSIMMARFGMNQRGPQSMSMGPYDGLPAPSEAVGPSIKMPGAFIPTPTPIGPGMMAPQPEGRTPRLQSTNKIPGYRF